MIAHRLSTVTDADQILVLRDGGVCEAGTHSHLLERGGEYARLWAMQQSRRQTRKRARPDAASDGADGSSDGARQEDAADEADASATRPTGGRK